MAWGSLESSTQLTLTGSYQTVQRSAADWEVTLNPGELAQIMVDFNPQGSATEDCDLIIQRTPDGTIYESDGEALRYIISHDNNESDDPAKRSIEITGVYGFQIRARVRDPDDTAGGDDTTSTVDIDIRKDGISL